MGASAGPGASKKARTTLRRDAALDWEHEQQRERELLRRSRSDRCVSPPCALCALGSWRRIWEHNAHVIRLTPHHFPSFALIARRASPVPSPGPTSREAEDVSALVIASMWSTWEQRCARYRERLQAREEGAPGGAVVAPSAQSALHAHNAAACARIVADVAAFAARFPHIEAYQSAAVLMLVSREGRVIDSSVHVAPSLLHVHSAEPGLLSDDVFESWYHSNVLAARALSASDSPTLRAALQWIDPKLIPSKRDTDTGLILCEIHVHISSNGAPARIHLADTSAYALVLSAEQRAALAPFVLGAQAAGQRGVLAPSAVVLPAFAALLRALAETRVIGVVQYKARVKRLVTLASPYLHALSELGTSPEALGIRQLLLGNVLRD